MEDEHADLLTPWHYRFFLHVRLFLWNDPSSTNFLLTVSINRANKCEKCPSSIRCWDSNPQPLEPDSPPKTTRPGSSPYRKTRFVVQVPGLVKHLHEIVELFMHESCFYFYTIGCVCHLMRPYKQKYAHISWTQKWPFKIKKHSFILLLFRQSKQ